MKGEYSPIRRCVVGINQNLVTHLAALARKKSKPIRILDVGCGSWSYLLEHLPKNVAWHGIDVVDYTRYGKKSIATKIGSVDAIPYADSSFDVVLANQSMEHWFEYGVTFRKAIAELSRVLKKGGELHLNAPVHLHGHPYFILGKYTSIKRLFSPSYWNLGTFETWRQEPSPLPPYYGWKGRFDSLTHGKSTHILEIVAQKKQQVRLSLWGRFVSALYSLALFPIPHKVRQLLILFFYTSPLAAAATSIRFIRRKFTH